jgi:hypothetical protein
LIGHVPCRDEAELQTDDGSFASMCVFSGLWAADLVHPSACVRMIEQAMCIRISPESAAFTLLQAMEEHKTMVPEAVFDAVLAACLEKAPGQMMNMERRMAEISEAFYKLKAER